MIAQLKILLLITSLTFAATGFAAQQPLQRHWPNRTILAEQDLISRDQAIAIAKSRYKGKVLSADLEQNNGNHAYRIKLLTDKGRVKTVRINAREKSRGKN